MFGSNEAGTAMTLVITAVVGFLMRGHPWYVIVRWFFSAFWLCSAVVALVSSAYVAAVALAAFAIVLIFWRTK